jgi:hypothetical protein
MAEYQTLLSEAGFSDIHFYAALPDYKLPHVILPADDESSIRRFFEEGNYIEEHNGIDGNLLANQEEIKSLYRALSHLGVVQYFVPSYFISAL